MYVELARWSALPSAELRAYLGALAQPSPDPIERTCARLTGRDASSRGLAKLLECDGALDAPLPDGELAPLAAAGYVYTCLGADRSRDIAAYALCGPEARALDEAVVLRELDAGKPSPAVRAMVRISLRRIQTRLVQHDQLVEKDGLSREDVRDMPERAWKRASELAREERRELAGMVSANDDRDRCMREAHRRIATRLKQIRPKTVEEASAALRHPITAALGARLLACSNDAVPIQRAARHQLDNSRPFAGPRTYMYWTLRRMIATAKGTPVFSESVLDSTFARLTGSTPRALSRRHDDEIDLLAPIKRVVKRGDMLRVEFAAERVKDTEQECYDTKRVRDITRTGNVVYEKKCKQARTVTRTITAPAVEVPAWLGGGLASGRYAAFICDRSPRVCAPIAVWHRKNKPELAAYLGAAL